MLSQRPGGPNLGWTGTRHHHRHLATVNGDRGRVVGAGAGAGADGPTGKTGKGKVYGDGNGYDHQVFHSHDQAPPWHTAAHKPSALRRPGSTTPRWTRKVLFNLGSNTVNYTWHQDDYKRSEGALTDDQIHMKQDQWLAEEDTEMLRQLHVRWNHFEESLPAGCKCQERLLYEESLRREQAEGYDIDSKYLAGSQTVGITDNHPRTPTIVTPTESNPRRVVVAEMISPVSTAQPHFNHNLNYAYAADKQAHGADDDAYGGDGEEDGGGVISDPERSVAVHGLGHKRDTSNSKRTSPILSPREAFQSPYGNRSRPRRTASDAGRGRRRPLSQAGPTATVTSAPQAHATSPQHAQLNTSTSKATLMLQLEHARAEIKRKDQAIAARDSKLAEAWLELDKKPADQEPAAVQPAVLGNAAAIDTGKTKRRKYRWMPSLGRKSKPSSKAPDAAATATALPASPPTGAATNREGDDALTWDSTAMVRYGTPVAADGESSGAIPALATGVGHGADVSMVRSEAARSFLPLENSRLSVIGPSTSIMQRAIDEAEEQDAERKLREEQATAFVEKKAAARVARTVRRTAADAPETRGGCAVAEPSGSVPTPADAGTLAGIIRGSTVAATSAQAAVAATSAPTIFGGATTRVAALAAFPGADMQATKFVPTTQSKKEARKWAAEQRKVHKQTQKLQKKQMKESARWAKEQAHIQKQESKMRAKEAKLARSQLKKAKALEAQATAAAAASGEAGAEDVNRTGFSGTGVEDMWETDVAWKQEVAYLQAEDPAMLQEELEARNASIHERSTTSSFRGGGSPGAASEGAGGGAAVNRSMSMAAVPVARAKSKRFRWGLSFLRRSKSMRAPETAATAQSATSIAVAKAVSALDAKPKRRWSIKAKFSFLRRKRTGNAAAIAARAAEAAENAASITSGDQRRQNNYTATTTAEDTSMSTDLDSLWLSLNPHAAGHATMTEI